jgi:hypothetical protein
MALTSQFSLSRNKSFSKSESRNTGKESGKGSAGNDLVAGDAKGVSSYLKPQKKYFTFFKVLEYQEVRESAIYIVTCKYLFGKILIDFKVKQIC